MPSEERLLDSLGVTSMVGELAGPCKSARTSLPHRTLQCWLGLTGNGRFRFDTSDSSLIIDRDAPQNIRHLSRLISGCTRWLAEAGCRFFELRCASLRTDRKSNQSQNLESTRSVHPRRVGRTQVAMIAFNLACYASVAGRMEDPNHSPPHTAPIPTRPTGGQEGQTRR